MVHRFPAGTSTRKVAGVVSFNMRRLHKYLRDEGLFLVPSKSKILCENTDVGKAVEDALNDVRHMDIVLGDSGVQLDGGS